MLPGLAPASSAMSRIETALKPRVENSNSAALRIASRILGFRVIGFAFCSAGLCTFVQITGVSQQIIRLQKKASVEDSQYQGAVNHRAAVARSDHRAFAGACTCKRS